MLNYLVKYVQHIGEVTERKEHEESQKYQYELKLERDYNDSLIENESALLDKLRGIAHTRPDKKLDFDEEAEHTVEFEAVSASSDASARIFTTLNKEGLINTGRLLGYACRPRISDGWVTFIKDFLNETSTTKDERQLAIQGLYQAGIDREKLRPELLKQVFEQRETRALELVLFRIEPATGKLTADVNMANLQLYRQLGKPEISPKLQVLCAQFAAEIRDYETCQSICEDLLSQKYQGLTNPLLPAPEADLELCRARERALRLMFETIKNEWSFSKIYARSELNKDLIPAELASKDKDGKPEAAFRSYPLGQMEAEYAESLVGAVSRWAQ